MGSGRDDGTLTAEQVGAQEPYQPQALAVVATPVPTDELAEPVDWPGPALIAQDAQTDAGSCTVVRGADLVPVLDAAGRAQRWTPWSEDGRTWYLDLPAAARRDHLRGPHRGAAAVMTRVTVERTCALGGPGASWGPVPCSPAMASVPDAPEPVGEDVLADLRARLGATRRVPVVPAAAGGHGWSRGVDPGWLTGLLADWATFDWRAQARRIRSLPWVARDVDGVPVRALHQRARGDEAPVVVLLHGWPDSVLRFEKVLPLLEDVHVVVPALPGYPFAPALVEPELAAMSTTRMADLVAGLVRDLGYQQVTISGGDVGSSVAETVASRHRDLVGSLHLTDIPYKHLSSIDPGELSEAERAYSQEGQRWQLAEGAYALEQATKPATLAVGLGDSPAGLAAWISEKLSSWSDCGGDVDTVFEREELLTWVTAYWVTGAIGTSFAPYANGRRDVDRVDVPTVVTQFRHDLLRAPRSFGERFFDVRVWDDLDSGGHFGAWERPQAFVDGVREGLRVAAG